MPDLKITQLPSLAVLSPTDVLPIVGQNSTRKIELSSLGNFLGSNYFVTKSGDTMTGALTLPSNPTINLHAATKQYVDGTSSLTTNGYQILPSGLIIQWGTVPSISFNQSNQGPFIFPTPFTSACFNVLTTINHSTAINGTWVANANTLTTTSFRIYGDYDVATGTAPVFWMAFGR